ncbi:MAG: hypothetical protein QF797_06225 [Alphaproteobacteria bacterium]|jgi:outer membrane biosynthesis protein TonB|nr:hypothetical protein [Rhodospirillaceae bacterium]MDP6404784.1 hypothetical protein [Alphaproteobacteria bacterium]MDP6622115.1 hypothetical protein [Alphaproteobacteria bacterium]|tara:strand:+ start:326 stop:859 length:534 start_codon:yes stop_codon:yes gene_type:complete
MKFLAFNLLAAVALVYLFSGSDGPSVEGALERASETAQTLVDKGRQAVSGIADSKAPEPKPEPVAAAEPEVVVEAKPEPKREPKSEIEPESVAPVAPTPAAPVPSMAELAKLLPVDQAVARRRAEVMAAAAPAPARAAPHTSKSAGEQVFMSREERQRELHRLAQEMELMFVDKVVK